MRRTDSEVGVEAIITVSAKDVPRVCVTSSDVLVTCLSVSAPQRLLAFGLRLAACGSSERKLSFLYSTILAD